MGMNLNVAVKGIDDVENILDLKVPPQLRVKQRTGINWFDGALGGQGFTPSTSMMLTGGPGCGKTTLMLQLADACKGMGHIAHVNTGEESLYQVKMVTERLKLKNGFVPGQALMAEDLINRARELQKKNPKKQVILFQDSIQTLNDGKYADGGVTGATPLRCVEMLTNWAKETFGIVVFIGQVTKSGQFAGKNAIKHAIDVHGHLFFDDDKKSETFGERIFEIPKNRFGANGQAYILGIGQTGVYEKGCFQPGQDWSPGGKDKHPEGCNCDACVEENEDEESSN